VPLVVGIQDARRMRRIILPSVACPAVQYFTTLSHKRQDVAGVGGDEHKMCVLILSTARAASVV
jgi:hypothetical protein